MSRVVGLLVLAFWALSIDSVLVKTKLPPRGWNSYDCWGGASNETITLETAQAVRDLLLPVGYNYVVLDAGWYGNSGVDQYGRWIPDANAYPSLKGSFKYLADQVHNLGLQFGLWYMYGIPQSAVALNTPIKGTNYTAKDIALGTATACPWAQTLTEGINLTHPAGYAYYQSVVELWVDWGIDFIKLDCVFAQNETPLTQNDIKTYSKAISEAARPIALSLSPGAKANSSALEDIKPYATMARVTEDLWDDWTTFGTTAYPSVVYPTHFDVAAALTKDGGDSFWIDLDMLPLGRIGVPGAACTDHGPGCARQTRYTFDEERTILTLWSMTQAPLMFGGDLRVIDPTTLSIISHPGVLQAQYDLTKGYQVWNKTESVLWAAASVSKGTGAAYVAIFNVLNTTAVVNVTFASVGLNGVSYRVNDIWANKDLGMQTSIVATLAVHGPGFYLVTPS